MTVEGSSQIRIAFCAGVRPASILALLLVTAILTVGVARPALGQDTSHADAARNTSPKPIKDKRVALIVGNSAYKAVENLKNPVADAAQMQITLQRLGFDLIVAQDATLESFRAKVAEFTKALRGAEIGLFFYAGHGVQYRDVNYLLPTDIELSSESDIINKSIALNSVLDAMTKNAKTSIVFLDACRESPQASTTAPGTAGTSVLPRFARGLANVSPSSADLFVGFAAAPGAAAKDGTGQNSPFTRALVANLPRADTSLSSAWADIRAAVMRESKGQSPEARLALSKEIILNPKNSAVPPRDPINKEEPESPKQPTVSLTDDAEFWLVIKDSSDPKNFDDYLQQFPDGRFKVLAKRRLDELARLSVRPSPKVEPAPTDSERVTVSGVATIGPDLGRAEAIRGAKALARARAIASRLASDSAKLPAFVASTADAADLQRWLERGLPLEETWTVHAGPDTEVKVELQAKIKAFNAAADRKLTGQVTPASVLSDQPLRIKLSARRDARFGVYAWQADGTMLRLYPSSTQGQGIDIKAGDTITFPRANDPYPNISTRTLPGQRANHEAIVVVTGSRSTTQYDLLVPLTVATSVRQGDARLTDEAEFFTKLAALSDPGLEVLILPYTVSDHKK